MFVILWKQNNRCRKGKQHPAKAKHFRKTMNKINDKNFEEKSTIVCKRKMLFKQARISDVDTYSCLIESKS